MEEVKKFIMVDLIVFIIKVIGGLLCHSLTMLASSIYELSLLLIGLFLYKKKDNQKFKGIISSIVGFLIVMLGLGTLYYGVILNANLKFVSWFVILFIFLSAIVRYIVGCFSTNMSYQRKEGILLLGKMHSTIDFIQYGVILASLILVKVSKWVKILKYADVVGMIIIVLFVFYKGIKIIVNSFKYLENKVIDNKETIITEIEKRDEIKKLDKIEISSFGGLNYAHCNIILRDSVSMIDVNTFVLTLQDYLLKFSDMVRINLVKKQEKKKAKVKVRSKKQDARNSGSGNSKANTKKKNTKKKNKKR